MYRKRALWLDREQHRRLTDGTYLTAQQVYEALLRAYAAGNITVTLPPSRKGLPGWGRVVVQLPDEPYEAAQNTVGEGRVSLLLNTLAARYLAGELAIDLVVTDTPRTPTPNAFRAQPPAIPAGEANRDAE